MSSRLKQIRNSKNITQSSLSSGSGVTQRTIQTYESKGITKKTSKVIKLAKFLEVSPDSLMDIAENELSKLSLENTLFDNNGNPQNLVQITSYIKRNLDLLKKEDSFKSLIDIEALKILVQAKEGDIIDITKIG